MSDAVILRSELKVWEQSFKRDHGRAPTKEDIKRESAIARKYKEYNRLKLGGTVSKPGNGDHVAGGATHAVENGTDKRALEAPQTPSSKRVRQLFLSPSKAKEQQQGSGEPHPPASPSPSKVNPFKRSPRRTPVRARESEQMLLGPTPSTSGRVFKPLFDAAGEAPAPRPFRRTSSFLDKLKSTVTLSSPSTSQASDPAEEPVGDVGEVGPAPKKPRKSADHFHSEQAPKAPRPRKHKAVEMDVEDSPPMPTLPIQSLHEAREKRVDSDDEGTLFYADSYVVPPPPEIDEDMSREERQRMRREEEKVRHLLQEPSTLLISNLTLSERLGKKNIGLEDLVEDGSDEESGSEWDSEAEGWKDTTQDWMDGM